MGAMRTPHDRRDAALLACVLLAGCATSLASGHAPRTLEKGRLEATAATGALVPAGVLVRMVDAGLAAGKRISETPKDAVGVAVDEATARDAAVAAAALVVVPPAPISELTVRYGITDRVEAGLRLSGPAVRAEGHVQLLRGDWNLVAGLGAARHAFESSALDLLDKFKLASFGRTDLEAELVIGREWAYGALVFGPRAVWSHFRAEGLLVNDDKVYVPGLDGASAVEVLDLGSSWIYGGFVGGRVGYKYVWLSAELGVYGSTFTPRVLGEERNLGGLVVFPQLGLVVRPP
jgi:hypothetical protein